MTNRDVSGGREASESLVQRVAGFRQMFPDGAIVTDVVHADAERVAVRAVISVPSGSRASAIAAATVGDADWAETMEHTEARAIGKALDMFRAGLEGARRAPAGPTSAAPNQPARRSGRPTNAPAPSSNSTAPDDALTAEYSWTAFWARIEKLGLTRDKVTETIGRPTSGMKPHEAIEKLREAGLWADPESPSA